MTFTNATHANQEAAAPSRVTVVVCLLGQRINLNGLTNPACRCSSAHGYSDGVKGHCLAIFNYGAIIRFSVA